MIASRAKSALMALSVLPVLTGSAALAQEAGKPLKLTPLKEESAASPPARPAPLFQPASQGPASQGTEPGDADPIFGPQQWQGTERVLAMALLARLPNGNLSRPLALIQSRLLAQSAEPPTGAVLPGAGRSPWLSLRLVKLAASAQAHWLDRALAAIPADQDDDVLASFRIDQLFLADKTNEACALAERRVAQAAGTAWRKSLIACQSLAGDHAKAALGLQLLQEQTIDDPALSTLVERLSGIASAPWPKDLTLTPLSAALMRKGRIDPPNADFRKSEPRLLAAVARSDAFSWPLRAAAAERAAQVNALAMTDLADLYGALPARLEELTAEAARRAGGAKGRAMAARLVRDAASPATRREAVVVATDLARKDDMLIPLAQLLAPVLADMPVASDGQAAAPDIVRLLLLAGYSDAARHWVEMLRQAAAPEAARAEMLLRLAEKPGLGPMPLAQLLAWASLEQGRGGEVAARLTLMFGLLDALGERIPAAGWSLLGDLPAQPAQKLLGAAPLIQMKAAAEAKRAAEAAALALILRGGGRGGALDGILVDHAIISTLRLLGLEAEARSLAVETAIQAGL